MGLRKGAAAALHESLWPVWPFCSHRFYIACLQAREGAPTPMDLRADHDGSPEWVRTGRVMEPYSLSMQDKFAVVYLKGHQYKVTVGDLMYVDQIPELDVNDRVDLTRVMLLGSRHDTIIGRPLVPGAKVTAGASGFAWPEHRHA